MYEVYGKGGSMGEIRGHKEDRTHFVSGIGHMWFIDNAPTKSQAQALAKTWKYKYHSPGERAYYGVRYRVVKAGTANNVRYD